MEGLNEGGKILGMPRKVAIPVLGIAVIAVVYVVLRSRSQGGSTQASAPEQAGGTTGGGGGGGGYVGGYQDAAPVNPLQEKLDRLYFEKEQFGYNIQQRQEGERQANWEIQHQEQQSSLDTFRQLLPFQLETQKAYESAQQAAYGADTARAGEEAAYSNRGAALQNQVTGYIQKGQIKPECGKNESSYLDPNTGEWRCKASGKSGVKSVGDQLAGVAANAGLKWVDQYLSPPGTAGRKVKNAPSPAPSGGYQEGGVGY